MQTLQTKFIQEKHLVVLEKPLILKGIIFIQKHGFFAWHVKEPLQYSLVIQGEVLQQWDEDTGRVEKVSLAKNPVFKTAIQQMRDWFSGEYRSMLGEYQVTVLEEAPVSLKFVPREGAFAQGVIESVRVVFEKDERYIRQIDIVERGGDRTRLMFLETLLNAPIDSSAWKVKGISSHDPSLGTRPASWEVAASIRRGGSWR